MANMTIPDDMFGPGDLVDVEFLVKTDNQVLLDMGIHNVKQTIAADERFNYQGSRWEERTDLETGEISRYLIITIEGRKSPKSAPERVYQAGVLWPLAIIAASVAAIFMSVVGSQALGDYTIRKRAALAEQSRQFDAVMSNPNIPEEDKAQYAADLATRQSGQTIGSGMAALGGSLVTAAIVVVVLWVVSGSGRGGAE